MSRKDRRNDLKNQIKYDQTEPAKNSRREKSSSNQITSTSERDRLSNDYTEPFTQRVNDRYNTLMAQSKELSEQRNQTTNQNTNRITIENENKKNNFSKLKAVSTAAKITYSGIKSTMDMVNYYKDAIHNMQEQAEEKKRIQSEAKDNPLLRQSNISNNAVLNAMESKYGKGNIDLNNRKVVQNEDGSISTERSFSFYDDKEKKEILIPSVIDGKAPETDKDGNLTEEAMQKAIDHYYDTGEYLGKFDTPEEADEYAENLHLIQQNKYAPVEKNKDKKWWQNFGKQSDLLKDGYNFGDISGTVGTTALDVIGSPIQGISEAGTGLANLTAGLLTPLAGWGTSFYGNYTGQSNKYNYGSGKKAWELAIGENKDLFGQMMDEYVRPDSALGRTSVGVLKGAGNTLAAAEVGAAIGVASGGALEGGNLALGKLNMPVFSFVTGAGNSLQEGFSREDYKPWEVWLNATGEGAIESFSEGMFGLFGVGGNEITDTWKGQAMRHMKTGLSKALTNLGISAAGEGSEEVVGYLFEYLLHNGIGELEKLTGQGDGSTWKQVLDSEEAAEMFFTSAISTLITMGASGFQDIDARTAENIQAKEQELGRKLSKQETKQIATDTLLAMEKEVEDSILGAEQEQENKKETAQEIMKELGIKTKEEQKKETIFEGAKEDKETKKLLEKDKSESETYIPSSEEENDYLKQKYEGKNQKVDEDVLKLLEQDRNRYKNDEVGEKRSTKIENKPLLEERQQTTLPETKETKNENVVENKEEQEKVISRNKNERNKYGEGRITGETDESYEVTYDKKDGNGNKIVKKYLKSKFDDFFARSNQEEYSKILNEKEDIKEQKETIKQEDNKKLPEIKSTNKVTEEQLNEIDKRKYEARKKTQLLAKQENKELSNRTFDRRHDTLIAEEEERARRYEKEDIKEYNKDQKDKNKDYSGDNVYTEGELSDAMINAKGQYTEAQKNNYIKKFHENYLENEKLHKAFKDFMNKKENLREILEDNGKLYDAIVEFNNLRKQQFKNTESPVEADNEVAELLKQDRERYQEAAKEIDKKIENETDDDKINEALVEKEKAIEAAEEKGVETNSDRVTGEEVGTIEENQKETKQKEQEQKPKNQPKESWSEKRDRETREHFNIDEDVWDTFTENKKWEYRNRFNKTTSKEVDSEIRTNIVENLNKQVEEQTVNDNDIDNINTEELMNKIDAQKTPKELWEEYLKQEGKNNGRNDELTFVDSDGRRISTSEDFFKDYYLATVTPEQFMIDLRNAVNEKNNNNLDDTYGITKSVYDKALKYNTEKTDPIIKALAADDDGTKLKALKELGNKDILSKDDFKRHFKPETKVRNQKNSINIQYSRYLDEKLRRLLYQETNEKYDLPDEFKQDEISKVRTKELDVQVRRKLADRIQKIVELFTNDKTALSGKAINPLELKEKMAKQLPGKLDNARTFAKDISFYMNSPKRVNEIAFDYDTAKQINEEFFDPIGRATAEENRYINDKVHTVDKYGIKDGSEDSKLVFQLIEGKEYNEKGELTGKAYNPAMLRKELKNDTERVSRILACKNYIESIYNELLNRANEVLKSYGLTPIPRRKGYVSHNFIKSTEALSESFAKLIGSTSQTEAKNAVEQIYKTFDGNLEGTDKDRPTSKYEKKRLGKQSGVEVDAIKAFKLYTKQMGDVIYLTEHVQRLRAFEKLLRQTSMMEGSGFDDYAETVYDFSNLTEAEQKMRKEMHDIGTFNEYADFIHEYTNNLAGQKKQANTLTEKVVDKAFKGINKVVGKVGKNAVLYNIATPATNLIPAAKTIAMSNPISVMKSLGLTASNIKHDRTDGFLDESDTWARRQGADLNLSDKTFDEMFNDAGMMGMNAVDNFTTEFIIRTRYLDNLSKYKKQFTKEDGTIDREGLHKKALYKADDFASRMLAERTKGTMPLMFEEEKLKAINQFQLEATNEVIGYMHDMSQMYQEEIKELGVSEKRAFANAVWKGAKIVYISNVFNNAFEMLIGSRPTVDLLQILKYALGKDGDDDDEEENTAVKVAKKLFGLDWKDNGKSTSENLKIAGEEALSYVPLINQLSDNSRIPVFNVFSDLKEGAESGNTEKVAKAASKLLLPGGAVQLGRLYDTGKVYSQGGNYTASGKLRYKIQDQDKNAGRVVQSLLFGTRNLPSAKEWAARDYKSLSEKQTESYQSMQNTSYKEYTKFLDKMNEINNDKNIENKKAAKIEAIMTNNKYSDATKEELFINEVASDNEKYAYEIFKGMGSGKDDEINNYLDFLNKKNDKEFESVYLPGAYDNKNGDKIEDSTEKKLEYINKAKLTMLQKIFLKMTNTSEDISRREKQIIEDYVDTLDDELYNKFYDLISNSYVGINYNEKGRNDVYLFEKKTNGVE